MLAYEKFSKKFHAVFKMFFAFLELLQLHSMCQVSSQ